MIAETIAFRDLERLLLGRELRSFLTPQGYRAITHDASDTIFLLPNYATEEPLAWHHLATVRRMLDERELMAGDEFDRFVDAARVIA